MSTATLRCAVYTRKSSEEGLDQAFNSLDAQREAGRDYIKSQRHQGWVAIPTAYDDGGFSGGSMERPALQQLLDDIRRQRVDVVLVYKVDRLSRSLADFARLMQVFDEHKVSFVSVTQQFNTTTSMGRLTLNMLLSFAQFEREVTGERIRDKIAATKRTGAWVCGQPPLGYRTPIPEDGPSDRRLRIVEPEAAIVRMVFESYVELGSLLAVAQRVNEAGYTTRRWTSSRGVHHGGRPFTAQLIYRMLNNLTYTGKILHRRGGVLDVHAGLHEPIIDQGTWDRAQAVSTTIQRNVPVVWTHTHLLRGKVRSFEGYAMSPASVPKKRVHPDGTVTTRRVFYYCSQKGIKQGYKNCPIKTINAHHLDDLVRALVLDYLHGSHNIDLRHLDAPSRDHWIRAAIHCVVLAPDALTVEIEPANLEACRHAAETVTTSSADRNVSQAVDVGKTAQRMQTPIPKCLFTPDVEARDERVVLTLHIMIKRHDNRRVLVAPDGRDLYLSYTPGGEPVPQPHLVRAIGQAFAWHRDVMKGMSMEAVATAAGVTGPRVCHMLLLTRLSPNIIKAALTGRVGSSISLRDLSEAARHLDWSLQAAALMLDPPNITARSTRPLASRRA